MRTKRALKVNRVFLLAFYHAPLEREKKTTGNWRIVRMELYIYVYIHLLYNLTGSFASTVTTIVVLSTKMRPQTSNGIFFGAFGEPYGIRNRLSDIQSRNRYFRKVHARFRWEQTGDAIYSKIAIPTFVHIVYYNRQCVTALVWKEILEEYQITIERKMSKRQIP